MARSKRKKPATAAAVADFGTRRLPGDVGHEDGSPPAHDDAPGADAPPTVSAAPPPKRRRSEPARTATHVVPAPAATTGVTLDHALSATLVVVLLKLAGMHGEAGQIARVIASASHLTEVRDAREPRK